MEKESATPLDRECPHCEGQGSATIPLPPSSPLLKHLGGAGVAMEVCPHGIRRRLVPIAGDPAGPTPAAVPARA